MSTPLKLETYDLIICGGGTAGCVLAARLSSSHPQHQILVLEAGSNANSDPRVYTPGMFPATFNSPDLDWNYLSERSPGLENRQIGHTRGKCLGGSSAINLMALCYPSQEGLDWWGKASGFGMEGWDWESMRPYYKKFQRFVEPSKEVRDGLEVKYLESEKFDDRDDGPIKASFPQVLDPLHQAWVDTWKGIGKHYGDAVDGKGVGGVIIPNTIDVGKGRRSYAGSEYLEPAMGRKNLHVVTEATVEKVDLEREEGGVRATGVRFEKDGKSWTAKARREVVLSGGVFGSPQMVELSGIGAKDALEKLGIECLIDNPNVGENMQDHLMCGPSLEVKDGVKTTDMLQNPEIIEAAIKQYNTDSTGPLSQGGGYTFAYTPLCNFLNTTTPEDITSLLETHLAPSSNSTHQHPNPLARSSQTAFSRSILTSPTHTSATTLFIQNQFHPGKNLSSAEFALSEPGNYISLITQLAHPFSRGSVHIASSNPHDHPKIQPNYLSHPLDAEVLARHLLQLHELSKLSPLSDFLKPAGRTLPSNEAWPPKSIEEAKDFARKNSTSNYHPSGTCAMMKQEMGGVVDARLRVYGTKNLRVVDASIFPIEPRGNILTSVYATAEKGAEMIAEDLSETR